MEPIAKGVPTRGLSYIQLESSNYWTLTHNFSFLGIKEEVALVIDNKFETSLTFAFNSNSSTQVDIDFRDTRSIQKRYTRTQQQL